MKSGTFIQAYTRYDVKDSDGDYGRKGMFTKTWSENFSRIRHLLNHDHTHPVGEPQKFYDDNEYAYVQSQIGNHDAGEDFKKMVDSNLIKEASYGYTVIKQNKLKDGNELLEVKLWEVSSLTGWGANQFTPVVNFVKSAGKEEFIRKQLEQYANLKSFCRNSTATDRTLRQLEMDLKHIEQQLIELYSTQAAEEPTLEPQQVKTLNVDAVLSFIKIKEQLIN